MAEKRKMKFGGVSEDTRVQSRVNFDVSSTNWKHDCVIKKVSRELYVKKKHRLLDGVELAKGVKPTVDQVHEDSITCALQFVFESPDGVRSYIEKMFEIDNDDKNYSMKERMMNENIAQIFEVCAGPGQALKRLNGEALTAKLGRDMDTWQDYFEAIALTFNTARIVDEKPTPVFMGKVGDELVPLPLRIKLSRWKNFLQLGKNNFIERATPNSILQKEPKEVFDLVETPKEGDSFLSPSESQDTAPAKDEIWPDL